ncbi:MAG: HTH domain-containing protein [Proteobacteria bacterium]|nr:HTH domain-containing protein [Pseudomonadota bacterium]MBU1695621.1 HTH domain-containing protein [Pseudomonadota bacterium]
MAIGPKQLTESETRNTARRAFQTNTKLTSSEIGKAIGRSRQAVDSYIADLRATTLLELDLKIFRLNLLGIPQDRIAKRLGIPRKTLFNHLAKMPGLAKWPNSDLLKGFTVPQVAQKHGGTLTHIIQAPLSSERFNPWVVAAMQKKKILGVTSRYVMILK